MIRHKAVNAALKTGLFFRQGYTLLELLVVLVIVGILTTMAVPGFRDTIKRNAMDSAMQELITAVGLARSEAITGGGFVSICRSTTQATCAAVAGADWDAGWIIFSDTGVAGTVDGADTLLRVHGPGNGQNKISLYTGLNTTITSEYLRFDADGFLDNSSSGAYFRYCTQDNVLTDARAIWITNTGRASQSIMDADNIHNDMAGANLACP